MKILQIARPAEGGMQKHLGWLIEYLQNKNYNVVTAGPPETFKGITAPNLGVDIPDTPSPVKSFKACLELAKQIKRESPDVIHCHGYMAAGIASIANRISGNRPLVFTAHNLFSPKAGMPSRMMLGMCVNHCRRAIAITESVRDSILATGIKSDKFVIIPNGIDVTKYDGSFDIVQKRSELGIDSNSKVIICIARLIQSKGVDFLIKALPDIIEVFPDTVLLIVGGGPQMSELKGLSAKLGISGRVVFAGYREDIPDLLAAADLSVLPSLMEGQSLVVLESMAAGKPVVASNTGGIAEMVADKKNGILFTPGDTRAISDAVIQILYDGDLYKSLSEAGETYVRENMSLDRMLTGIERVYLEIQSK